MLVIETRNGRGFHKTEASLHTPHLGLTQKSRGRQSGLTWGAQFHEFLRDSGSFQLTTHPWNVDFDLLAQDGGQKPRHHTHTLGMEEEGKRREQRYTLACEGRLSEAGR